MYKKNSQSSIRDMLMNGLRSTSAAGIAESDGYPNTAAVRDVPIRPAPVFNRKRQVKPGRPRSPGKWAGNRDGGNETLWDRERDGDGDPDFPLKSWKWINKATTWLWAQVRGARFGFGFGMALPCS